VSGSPNGGGPLDVLGLGNALVDVLSPTPDKFLDQHGLVKGSMALIDADQATTLYEQMGPATEQSGGSAANTVVGVASLGGASAFVGRVRDDTLGDVFAHDIRAAGVRFDTRPATSGQPTGRCLILVTPDAERTLNTFLGAAAELRVDDVTASLVEAAAVTYLEGYLFDQPDAKAAFRHAASAAHRAGRQVALSLSDMFCVERHRMDFLALVEHDVDLLFGNDGELCALYEVERLPDAVDLARRHCPIAAITLAADGSLVATPDGVAEVPVHPVPGGVVDTTGAGDLYAAGFLYGFTHGRAPDACGQLGALAASEVISHLGARPERSLAELAASVGS
jgi:sugar/nucleoside kinase (ribokinase family)